MMDDAVWLFLVATAFVVPRLQAPQAVWPVAGAVAALWGARMGWTVWRRRAPAVGMALATLSLWLVNLWMPGGRP